MAPGTRREAGLTEGSGGRAQPNGARARLGRGGQKGTLLPWSPWVDGAAAPAGGGGAASDEPRPPRRLGCPWDFVSWRQAGKEVGF